MANIFSLLFCLVSVSSTVVALEQSAQTDSNCGDVTELRNAMQVNIFLSFFVVHTQLMATGFTFSNCIYV